MGDQDERRKRRDVSSSLHLISEVESSFPQSLYRQRTDHRRSVAALRDKQVELRRLQLEEQQRERQALREALKKGNAIRVALTRVISVTLPRHRHSLPEKGIN